ncbi:MAG: hypothetical protein M5R40_20800 [Anaerolineae bacterium]|nr:hypothetical protein [Anaerolineae bacterium]
MNKAEARSAILIVCEDPKRAQATYAALQQFITPDLVMQIAPDLDSSLARAGERHVDLILLCGGSDATQRDSNIDILYRLRAALIEKPVLILMPPAERRQCYPLLDDMGAVECVHFSVVRAGRLGDCVRDLCRRHRQAEDFAELSQRCIDLEAENAHLHRRLAQLTRDLEEARRQR